MIFIAAPWLLRRTKTELNFNRTVSMTLRSAMPLLWARLRTFVRMLTTFERRTTSTKERTWIKKSRSGPSMTTLREKLKFPRVANPNLESLAKKIVLSRSSSKIAKKITEATNRIKIDSSRT